MTRLGFSGIPSIVGTHAQTGAVVSREGALPTAALAELLGLQVPGRLRSKPGLTAARPAQCQPAASTGASWAA
jgi:hypothetical protein